MRGNRNAYRGSNVEILFKNSVGDHPRVIKTIQDAFGIEGRYLISMQTGGETAKCDVKMSFAGDRTMDANVKAYKGKGYNQVTRMPIDTFAERFDLSQAERSELKDLVLSKSANTKSLLFPQETRQRWKQIFEVRAKRIVSNAFSANPSREILVLYDACESVMRIWKMKDVLKLIGSDIQFTSRGGNIMIGGCIVFQRKGGNGQRVKLAKTDPKHPGNDVQIKLDITRFLGLFDEKKITNYKI
ncbi:MAG: hypothetical protein F4235_02590 [Candidatus Dadabacteria bacterium]|nr:hypothetical protein [Candidatus Dadabacteria bacterium]MYE60949.1 hypothetical protein [Candidatus Dadabacteria bacterium]